MIEHSSTTSDTAATFEALASVMYAADDYDDVYRSMCEAAVRLIDGCDHASLMLLRHGQPYTAAATDDVAEYIDGLEREIGDGPCLDAIMDEATYVDSDLTDGS